MDDELGPTPSLRPYPSSNRTSRKVASQARLHDLGAKLLMDQQDRRRSSACGYELTDLFARVAKGQNHCADRVDESVNTAADLRGKTGVEGSDTFIEFDGSLCWLHIR